MAENKKEMERAELHRTIWAIADEMWRYISENGNTFQVQWHTDADKRIIDLIW